MNIQFYIEERKGYVLEEMGFVVGKWESKHPFKQLDRFIQEAKFKSTLHKLQLERFMGKENYIKAHVSLLEFSENIRKKLMCCLIS